MIHLPNPLAKNPVVKSQLFLVVVLSEQYAAAALCGVVDGSLQIKQHSEDHHWQDEESCLGAVDQSLQDLGKEAENIGQTLFALPSDWVDAAGIVIQRKHLFQRMTKEMSLEPIGFVVSTEAMTQYLTQTSPQLNIMVIEVGVPALTVALVKTGQIAQTIKVGRSGDAVSDLREALAHSTQTNLPAKMELYSPVLSQEELGEVQQQLMSCVWQENYPFLHPPVIEVFEEQTFLEVVIKTGGMALAKSKGWIVNENKMDESLKTSFVEVKVAERKENEEEKLIDTAMPEVATPVVVVEAKTETTTPEVETQTESKIEAPNVEVTSDFQTPKSEAVPELAVEPKVTFLGRSTTPKESNQQINAALPIKPEVKERHKNFLQKHLIFIILGVLAGLAILVLLFFVIGQRMLQAKVGLTLKTQTISKDLLLTLSPQIEVSDPSKLLLKAVVVTQDEQGNKTADTTGNKIIGDKAKGTVAIYNYTSNQKTFSSGTKLTSGKFTYILDSDTSVASSSSSLDSSNNLVTKPGTGTATATATVIGEDSNLAAGSEMTIENSDKSTYMAMSASAFSGGTSREIQAVSQNDRDQLLNALKKDLVAKATQDIATAATKGQYQVPTNRVKVIKSTYSANVGDETNSLDLQLSLQVEFLQYQTADLQPLAQQVLAQQVPAGYELVDGPPQVMSVPATTSTSSAQITLQTNLSAVTQPQLNLNDLKSAIAGQSEKTAVQTISAHEGVLAVQVQYVPQLVGSILHKLPADVAKIEITKNSN